MSTNISCGDSKHNDLSGKRAFATNADLANAVETNPAIDPDHARGYRWSRRGLPNLSYPDLRAKFNADGSPKKRPRFPLGLTKEGAGK